MQIALASTIPMPPRRPDKSRRLIGQVLVDADLITATQLACALDLQRRQPESDAIALADLGLVDATCLNTVLAPQDYRTAPGDILRKSSGNHHPLGQLLLLARRLTRQQLSAALAEQADTHERLGAILVRRGWLTVTELAALLAFQSHHDSAVDGENQSAAANMVTRGAAGKGLVSADSNALGWAS